MPEDQTLSTHGSYKENPAREWRTASIKALAQDPENWPKKKLDTLFSVRTDFPEGDWDAAKKKYVVTPKNEAVVDKANSKHWQFFFNGGYEDRYKEKLKEVLQVPPMQGLGIPEEAVNQMKAQELTDLGDVLSHHFDVEMKDTNKELGIFGIENPIPKWWKP